MLIMTFFSTGLYVDIELEGNFKEREYFAQLYVDGREVAKSTNSKPYSSALKWEWNSDNEM